MFQTKTPYKLYPCLSIHSVSWNCLLFCLTWSRNFMHSLVSPLEFGESSSMILTLSETYNYRPLARVFFMTLLEAFLPVLDYKCFQRVKHCVWMTKDFKMAMADYLWKLFIAQLTSKFCYYYNIQCFIITVIMTDIIMPGHVIDSKEYWQMSRNFIQFLKYLY